MHYNLPSYPVAMATVVAAERKGCNPRASDRRAGILDSIKPTDVVTFIVGVEASKHFSLY